MYRQIIGWSEVWAILIPLLVFFMRRNWNRSTSLVMTYLICALCLNSLADVIRWLSVNHLSESAFWRYNNWVYNTHSIVRTIIFIIFFYYVGCISKLKYIASLLTIFLVTTGILFIKKNFLYISSELFTLEGIILLICCVSFFIQRLKDEELYLDFDVSLIIVTGLTIYESINFFIFLFFNLLMTKAKSFAITIWDVHNISFIIFCLFIAYAFYGKQKIATKEYG